MPKTTPITVRLDSHRVKRIFDLKEHYPRVYPQRMRNGRYNRSTILLLILDRGLDALEAELAADGWTGDE